MRFHIYEFDEAVRQIMLQSLTLGSMTFTDTDLDNFWFSLAHLKLKQLRLDYITFDNFDPNEHTRPSEPHSKPVAMPAVVSMLVNLR